MDSLICQKFEVTAVLTFASPTVAVVAAFTLASVRSSSVVTVRMFGTTVDTRRALVAICNRKYKAINQRGGQYRYSYCHYQLENDNSKNHNESSFKEHARKKYASNLSDLLEEKGRVCFLLFYPGFARFVWVFVFPSPSPVLSPLLMLTKLKQVLYYNRSFSSQSECADTSLV